MRPRTLTTRAQRRLTQREATKIADQFTKVVRDFEAALFDESVKPGLETYLAIYTKYDRRWRRICEQFTSPAKPGANADRARPVIHRLRFAVPDADFFEKHFKPQVAVA